MSGVGSPIAASLLSLSIEADVDLARSLLARLYHLRGLSERELAEAVGRSIAIGDVRLARGFAERWIAECPDSGDAALAIALTLVAGQERALPTWARRAIVLGNRSAIAMVWCGQGALARREAEEARRFFVSAVILGPDIAEAYAYLAVLTGDEEGAASGRAGDRALRLDPSGQCLVRAGTTLFDAGRTDVAGRLFETARSLPGWPNPLIGDPALVRSILNGESLAAVMTLDPRSVANWPEYRETYNADFIYVSGDHFWAYPQTFDGSADAQVLMSFCYSSDRRMFGRFLYGSNIYSDDAGEFIIMPGDAYRDFAFTARPDHALVYDSLDQVGTDGIAEAIGRGAAFKCAMLTERDVWMVMPLNLMFWYPHDGSFKFTTELRVHAAITDWPAETWSPIWQRVIQGFASRSRWSIPKVDLISERSWSRLSVKSDGTYTRYGGRLQTRQGRYKRLRIFARS